MLEFIRLATDASAAEATVTLSYELRQRSRLRIVLDDGREAAVLLPRGSVLRPGSCLTTTDGLGALVRAASETVSSVECSDPLLLARACYHLGNRHVPLQIGPGWLRYGHDHVLDDMLRGLGLSVGCEQAPFDPEPGAYGGGHGQAHPHGHTHD